jgi:hypothetical protein
MEAICMNTFYSNGMCVCVCVCVHLIREAQKMVNCKAIANLMMNSGYLKTSIKISRNMPPYRAVNILYSANTLFIF